MRVWVPRTSATLSLFAIFAIGSPWRVEVAAAQGVTGAALTGTVIASDGTAIRGAVVRLRNASTGTGRQTQSLDDGRFHFEDVPVGGPYELSARALGYEPVREQGLTLHLGDRVGRTIVMRDPIARQLDEVAVRESPLRDAGAGGPAYAIPGDVGRRLPIVNRDFVRLLALAPQATGSTLLSVSGQHNRFNAIQVDGGSANDFFGTGITPGANAGARALSLEAIEEIRILIAPFDVRQGGFSGALVNAVTRSGTNTLRGSLFTSVTSAGLVGVDASGGRVPAFRDAQYGVSVGGPILRDRLHFFVVADLQSRRTDYTVAPVSDATTGISEATAERASQVFRDRYGFEAGSSAAPVLRQPNQNVLLKLSWQPTINHTLELTQGWVDAATDIAVRTPMGQNGWQLSGSGSVTATSTVTTRLRATSAFGQWTNELAASAMTIGDDHHSLLDTPMFLVQSAPGIFLAAGSSRATQGTATDQRILELTDNLSWHRGAHSVTLGTQNQIVRIRDNLMLNAWGVWTFANVDSLDRGAASRYEVGLPVTPGSHLLDYSGLHLAGYIQDRWSPTAALTVTYGARLEAPFFDAPSRNARLADTGSLRIDTGRFPSGNVTLSPRASISWALGAARRTMLRGGVGVFAARPPYAWLNNAYNGTGLEQTSLTCTTDDGVPAPTTDVTRVPTQCVLRGGQVPLPRVNYFDRDVRFPQAVKLLVGVDRELGSGLTASLDVSRTLTRNHFFVEDANLVEPGTSAEGRAMYGAVTGAGPGRASRQRDDFGALYRFSNRSADRSSAISALLVKRWRNDAYLQAGYSWSHTEDLMSLSGLTGVLIFQTNPIDGTVRDRRLSRSARDIPHNFVVAGIAPPLFGVTASAFLRARSGTPFAYSLEGDANGDGTTLNDLAYVPRDSADITLVNPSAWGALDAYIDANACLRTQRGTIVRRNSCRNPAVRAMDVRLARRFSAAARNAELSVDVINLPSLLHREWGLVRETTTREVVELLSVQGWDAAANRPRYAVRSIRGAPAFPVVDAPSTTDGSLASRWRIQIGARFDY